MRRILTAVLLAGAFAAYPAVAQQHEDQQKPRQRVPAATDRQNIERNRQDQNRDTRAWNPDRGRNIKPADMERRNDGNRNANGTATHPKRHHKMHGHSARHHQQQQSGEH
jgi:hypothetical protein